ncbi:XrtB/PEP-CTERM-associated polysaccharide biosynthesis outer membrane protein EpsL [Herbaspirillum sp.]|uniref:XrtB/PEP-CTERM-associated polysaccharide biosynthesis outer membrane protein EpsL n=1 Tax=Herbaspirillum sp. TaxID=1890675 RepID=UPI0031DA8B8C
MMLRRNFCFSARLTQGIAALLASSATYAQTSGNAGNNSNNNGQVVTPYVQYSMTYDDNVLRLKDAEQARSILGTDQMSDTYRTAVGGIRIDKMISRQHLTLDASLNRTDFDHFRQFDNTGKDAKGDWGWAIGNYFSGNIGYIYSEALTPFQNFRVFEKNLRTQKTKYASAAWRMHPDWTLRAQFTRLGLDYSLASQQINTFTQDISEVGLDYTARSGSIAGIQLRHTNGNYPNPTIIDGEEINNSFKQDEIKAKVLWLYSGKTRLQFLGGLVERKRQSANDVNFSGFNARLIGDWAATGQTSLTMNLWREIGGLNDVDANYALTNGVSLAATTKASDKLKLDGLVDYEKRNYNGATVITGVTPSGRRDKYGRAAFSVTYMPLPSWSLMASIFREKLQSNIDNFGYVSNGVVLTARYEF